MSEAREKRFVLGIVAFKSYQRLTSQFEARFKILRNYDLRPESPECAAFFQVVPARQNWQVWFRVAQNRHDPLCSIKFIQRYDHEACIECAGGPQNFRTLDITEENGLPLGPLMRDAGNILINSLFPLPTVVNHHSPSWSL